MKAKLKSGRVLTGKLADIFIRKGIAIAIPNEENSDFLEKSKRGRKPKV